MISRSTLIVALVALEFGILAEAVVAVSGGQPTGFAQRAEARPAPARLAEGGEHRVFSAGSHPALSIDIGYADLKIMTSTSPQIDVSLSPTTDDGPFQATEPITAREDGDTIRIAATGGWSMGDDRMVTVLVPAETKVTVVHAGDIKVSGLRADASFNSVGSGSVTVDDYDASALSVASARGRISLHDIVAARLQATTSDGVVGTALTVRDGSIESGDRISLGFAAGANTRVTAEASSGSIHVSGLNATPSVDTKNSDDDDEHSQSVQVGTGGGHLDVHASDGNITLSQ